MNSRYSGYKPNRDTDLSVIELLLSSGADINAKGDYHIYWGYEKLGWTPLMQATFSNDTKCIRLLIKKGAKAGLRDDKGRTVLVLALELAKESDYYDDVVRLLAQLTADGRAWAGSRDGREWMRLREADATAPLGLTPENAWSELQSAMTDGSKREEIKKWVESGGNIHWKRAAGLTLLHYAAMRGNEEMVRFLLDHGANVNATTESRLTPLLCACKEHSTDVIPVLLDHGADPGAETTNGYTALRYLRGFGTGDARKMEELIKQCGVATTPGKGRHLSRVWCA